MKIWPVYMDSITIKGIRFHGHHGVTKQERDVGGHYEVDVILRTSLVKAGKSDALEDTIDYASVVDLVVEIGTQQNFQLIEALAETSATEILKQFLVDSVSLTIKKLHPPICNPTDYFAVEICRKKES